MSASTLKPVACWIPPPVTGPNGSHSKVSKVEIINRQVPPALQVKEKESLLLQEITTSTSRRGLMHMTAASISLLPLLLPVSAEARPRNAAMRQKIMEKLEELRRKAGLSKPKDQAENTKSEPKEETQESQSKQSNNGDEVRPEPSGPSLPLPGLPNILSSKIVEPSLS